MKSIKEFLIDSIKLISWLAKDSYRLIRSLITSMIQATKSNVYWEKLRAAESFVIQQFETHLPNEPKLFWVKHHRKILKIVYFFISVFILLNIAKCAYTPEKVTIRPVVEGRVITFEGTNKALNGIKSIDLTVGATQQLNLSGRLVWNEEKTAKIYSPFSGRVESVEVQPGQKVEKNQVLAVIQSADFGNAQADFKKAQASANAAKANLARSKELFDYGIVSQKDYEQIVSDSTQAIAEFDRANARLKSVGAQTKNIDQKFLLRSPTAGIVVEKNIYPGRELNSDLSNTPAIVVSDPTNLWAVLEASEIDVGRFEIGAEVTLQNNTLPNEKLIGKIIQIADFVDPVTRTIKVRVNVPNQQKKLRAEMFVEAEIPLSHIDGIVVPAKAVILVGTHHFVFVEIGPNKYLRQGVSLGARFADKVEILEGLKPEHRVVIEGNLYLNEIFRDSIRSSGSTDPAIITPAKPLIENYPLDLNSPHN